MRYFSVKNIDNPCHLTIACNPKGYFEMFPDSEVNKKHKRMEKGSSGMCFENYASRIVSLTNFKQSNLLTFVSSTLKRTGIFKKNHVQKNDRYFWDKKEELLEKKIKAQKQNKMMRYSQTRLTIFYRSKTKFC